MQELPEPMQSSIYRSLVSNTSKEMMCFSDFPMPDDYPNYMHNSQLLQYLRLYTEHFNLLKYIVFQVDLVLNMLSSLCQVHLLHSNMYVFVNVGMHTPDQSEKCYTKTRLLCVGTVGRSDDKQKRRGRALDL